MTALSDVTDATTITARKIELTDDAGRVRIRLSVTDEIDETGASITFFDRHGRRVLDVGVKDGLLDSEQSWPTHVYVDRIAEDRSGLIDPELDVPVLHLLSH